MTKDAIDCGYAVIDVKKRRKSMRKRLISGEKIRVVIVGYLDGRPSAIGNDDGESVEFQVTVESCNEVGVGGQRCGKI